MNDKVRIMMCSLIIAVPVYFWLARDPYLPPQLLYGIAAGMGGVAGVVFNFFWKKLNGKGAGK